MRHRLAYPAFFRATIRELLGSGRTDAAVTGGALVGVAAWRGPTATRAGWSAGLVVDRLLVRLCYPRGSLHLDEGFAAIAGLHPAGPHWYLAFIGIEPRCQGRGLGRALLRPVLHQADAAALPCYLETPFARTLDFYRGLGFEVASTVPMAFGLGPLWTMLRPASVGSARAATAPMS